MALGKLRGRRSRSLYIIVDIIPPNLFNSPPSTNRRRRFSRQRSYYTGTQSIPHPGTSSILVASPTLVLLLSTSLPFTSSTSVIFSHPLMQCTRRDRVSSAPQLPSNSDSHSHFESIIIIIVVVVIIDSPHYLKRDVARECGCSPRRIWLCSTRTGVGHEYQHTHLVVHQQKRERQVKATTRSVLPWSERTMLCCPYWTI